MALNEYEFENFCAQLHLENEASILYKAFDPFNVGEISFYNFSELMIGCVNPSIVVEEFLRNRDFLTWVERFAGFDLTGRHEIKFSLTDAIYTATLKTFGTELTKLSVIKRLQLHRVN